MSNIAKGYKQTEAGVIPEDWEVVCLGEMTIKVGSGITPTGGERVYMKEGRPFLRSQNVGWGHLLMDDIAFIDDTIHETFRATEILDNDVFLNITGASIGRSAVADSRVEGGNVNQHVCIIRTVNDKLNPHFLNFILLSKVGQKQIDSFQTGGNRQGLNFGQIRSFKIPLPTKAEQTAIAAALSDADALISSLEKLIAKKRNIKQGAMQELLTGKKRLPGFSGVWEVKKLGEIAEINMGQSPDSKNYNSRQIGVPLIQGNADIENRKSIKRIWTTQITKTCDEGDLIMTVRAPVGAIGIASENSCIGRGVCSLKPKNIDRNYLFHLLIYNETKWKIIEQGSTFTSANSNQILNFQLSIVNSIAEQTAIAQILTDMDAEIEKLEQTLAKYRQIKQGMMQELLTGKTRLIDN
ncbi:MAG: restriction endonuclease subunit S [Candidatus Brocadiaceae bacterium]|nr:restriction endonuclease subunit S [Candidatus Brocadiaceae bacterium]